MSATPKPIFTFAIVSDTHVRPPGGDQSSPFPVNLKANDRARYAVERIAGHRPALTIHLGDMVHPMPSLPTFPPAAEEAKRILAPLMPHLHFVPGNHDAGDKPLKGLPAEFASEESLALYNEHFGPSWKALHHGGIRFLVINSSLINRGLAAEAEQWRWLERELSGPDQPRTFAFIHYPPFITEPNEASHYDNLDEPGRSRLLDLLTGAKVEAVFSGHVHHVFFNRLRGTHLYVLPPTSFIRQDYSELFAIEPAAEYGRDDTGKYGYTLVDVFADGHRVRIFPTDGAGRTESGELVHAAAMPAPADPHPRGAPLVAHLRHAWATPIAMPYNGPMEEFSRKRARNDALLIRLWQLGIRRVRTPLADLLEPAIRARVEDFHAAGISFTFFTLQPPDAAACAALRAACGLTDALQVVTSRSDLADVAGGIAAMGDIGDVPVVVGKLHSSADEPRHGSHFAHAVSFGFKWYEHEAAVAAAQSCAGKERIAGLAFQVNLGDDIARSLADLDDLGAKHGLAISANVRLANENPAVANFDDAAILARLQACIAAAPGLRHTTIEIDTLMDLDRGYNPRHGLLDRRCNFRPAGRWLAGLA